MSGEFLADAVKGDAKNSGWVEGTSVKDLLDVHLVLERSNLELVEESGLTGGDLVVYGDNFNSVNDFDLTFDNLGLDVKGLEERCLFWVHAGGAGGDSNISGSD